MDFVHSNLQVLQRQLSWVSTSDVDWQLWVQGSSWTVAGWEIYLLLRQYPLYSLPSPPPALSAHISQDTFEKSQKYGKDKARLQIFSKVYGQVVDSAMLAFGFYPWCWKASGSLVERVGFPVQSYVITHSIAFCFLLAFLSSIPSMPVSYYSTFVVEQKHGFNKQTPKLFFEDIIKGYAVSVALGAPLLAVFLKIFDWAGERFVAFIMLFMLGMQMLLVVLYPTVIQPLFNTLTPLKSGEVRTRVEALASALRFPLKHLYEIDGSKRSSHSNAYFFGLPWSKHIVIFDTLLEQSPAGDVEAVLAHELGHWYLAHPTKMMAVGQLHMFSILAVFPAFLHAPAFLRAFGFDFSGVEGGAGAVKGGGGGGGGGEGEIPTILAFLLFQMVLMPMEAVVSALMSALSRRFEWEADRFACEIGEVVRKTNSKNSSGKESEGKEGEGKEGEGKEEVDVSVYSDIGDRLARALITLHVKNLSTMHVDWMYSAYHHSHPTLLERLKELEVLGKKKA
ncbi:metalloendopeptidase [Cylindrobasidium torrendii FP15055 ss-10]|uniref:Ste24 endopeptidase n=1 Tax=Cylindrobasidium torrendii FP15055 ss-10 TaxID=1314674 RepID=A0A0D7B978_9AGAR|nr:metalloendopeptidase [Cylindrobasidium torrendii FP15055 ss-10]